MNTRRSAEVVLKKTTLESHGEKCTCLTRSLSISAVLRCTGKAAEPRHFNCNGCAVTCASSPSKSCSSKLAIILRLARSGTWTLRFAVHDLQKATFFTVLPFVADSRPSVSEHITPITLQEFLAKVGSVRKEYLRASRANPT